MAKKYQPVESIHCPNCRIELIDFINAEYSIRRKIEPQATPGVNAEAASDYSAPPPADIEGEPEWIPEVQKKARQGEQDAIFEIIKYRPSWFAFPREWTLIFIGLFVFMFPLTVLSMAMGSRGVNGLADYPWLVSGLQGAAGLLAAFYAGKIFLTRLSRKYLLNENTAETITGIIARNRASVQYQDILSVDVRQGYVDRILGIGAIELASAGTNRAEVQFHGVSDPENIQKIINERMYARRK